MQTKNIRVLVCFAIMTQPLIAAEPPLPNKEHIAKVADAANKKALVANHMMLTKEQETVFWPMYDEFQILVNKLNADREAVLMKYAVNYKNMSDELASELLDKTIDVEKKQLDLKKTLISKFSKSFPPKVVARYFQIENKLDMALTAEAAGQVPLVK